MAKKSAAKIRRNMARAAARGEEYTPPEPTEENPPADAGDDAEDDAGAGDVEAKRAAGRALAKTLAALEANVEGLNAKERRSAKRKAEVVAAEAAGCPAAELLAWCWRRGEEEGGPSGPGGPASAAPLTAEEKAKLASAQELRRALEEMEGNDALNAKERRSAKRRAEAIAAEDTGVPAEELLAWYATVAPPKSDGGKGGKRKGGQEIPYIVFVGQMSYATTADGLFDHFHATLGSDVISREKTKIRLLTDAKTKKSRGMAFVEVDSPEAMYECLRMHLTHLDGRRINGAHQLLTTTVPLLSFAPSPRKTLT